MILMYSVLIPILDDTSPRGHSTCKVSTVHQQPDICPSTSFTTANLYLPKPTAQKNVNNPTFNYISEFLLYFGPETSALRSYLLPVQSEESTAMKCTDLQHCLQPLTRQINTCPRTQRQDS